MNKIIVIRGTYKPYTAPMNRLLSMLKGFDELGVEVEMVFAYPNDTGDTLDGSHYKNVRIINLGSSYYIQNKMLNYILSFWNVWRYARRVNKGSKVFLSGASEYVPIFIGRKEISVYHERTEHYNVVKLKPLFLQKLYLKTIRQLHGMFVISTALRDTYMKVGVKNVNIINMTVDANRFANIEKQEVKFPYIAYCGTASNNKDGVDDLIKAFAIIHKQEPEIKLYIVGKAPNREDESGNMQLVKTLELDSSVVFNGVISSEEMPQMLKNAKILALARPDSLQAQSGFPTKLGEYLLSGNPVVVTCVGDIPLFLEDRKTALLSAPHNPQSFAEKLQWALNHEKEAKEIGLAGREVALRCFNYKTETEKIVRTIFTEKA